MYNVQKIREILEAKGKGQDNNKNQEDNRYQDRKKNQDKKIKPESRLKNMPDGSVKVINPWQ